MITMNVTNAIVHSPSSWMLGSENAIGVSRPITRLAYSGGSVRQVSFFTDAHMKFQAAAKFCSTNGHAPADETNHKPQ